MHKKVKKITLQRETVRQLSNPELGEAKGVRGCPTLPCTNRICMTKNNCTTICSQNGCSSL
jgi:hypothetical protein